MGNEVLTPPIKPLTEAAMKVDLDASDGPDRKNGSTPKVVKSPVDESGLHTSRKRTGSFEPQIVKKRRPSV